MIMNTQKASMVKKSTVAEVHYSFSFFGVFEEEIVPKSLVFFNQEPVKPKKTDRTKQVEGYGNNKRNKI